MLSLVRGWLRLRSVKRVASAPEGKYPVNLVKLARDIQRRREQYRSATPNDSVAMACAEIAMEGAPEAMALFLFAVEHFERTGELPEGF